MNVRERQANIESGALVPAEDELWYTTSMLFVPASVLKQFFVSIKRFWPSVFTVWILYGSPATAEASRKTNTVDLDTLKAKLSQMRESHKSHKSPQTGTTIILTTYGTGSEKVRLTHGTSMHSAAFRNSKPTRTKTSTRKKFFNLTTSHSSRSAS
ncbi:Uncharacterized protein TCAP_06776 [Tolypocladium capitatum]|uniref:Uncharacterized protein n=1 Tax=Tolypocladium capitatum TaxID=45235 RepID=A0A2K3Q6Z0_9HYPO|nr:Uncharacterized protein TCAP_06776 [Tolypocladium capitatum]